MRYAWGQQAVPLWVCGVEKWEMKREDGRKLPLWALPPEHFKCPAKVFRLQAVMGALTVHR